METLRLAALTHLHSLSFDELGQLAPEASEVWVPAGRRALYYRLQFVDVEGRSTFSRPLRVRL